MAMNSIPAPGASPFSFWGQGKFSSSSKLSQQWRTAVVCGIGSLGLGLALSRPELTPHKKVFGEFVMEMVNARGEYNVGPFASISLATAGSPDEVVEPSTGMPFPGALNEVQLLTGTGLRKKSILGLKKITVYTYGVYADPESLRQELGDKYGSTDPEKLKKLEEFFEDVMENDVELSVRLIIVYGHLKIGSMRSAFEDSVGGQIKKFSGGANSELLARFTSAFKDDIKLPKGTTIDLTRLPGNILQTKIDGNQVGSVQSALLCRSLFNLYIGDDAFDKSGKESIGLGLASLISSEPQDS